MANRISILVALEGADEGLTRTVTSAERSLGELASSAKTAGDKATAGMAEVKAGMNAFGEQIDRAKTQLLAFLTISWVAEKVQEIVEVADAWNMMSARLKLATAGQREYAVAQKELFDIAQRIGVSIEETATLYGKLQQAVRQLGGEQKDALSLTESISQALRISGASATEAQSALLQSGQALASDVLRGEEFNSVVENSPRLTQALADGLNVPIGRLRAMAEQGRLTADVVVNALMSQKDKLASEYAQLPMTVSQAFTRLSNAFGQWISEVEQSVTKAQATVSDATAKMAEAYKGLTTQIEASVAQQVQAVKDRYEQEKTALELSRQSEATKITQSTQLLTDALTQQTALRRQATTDTLQLIDQESQARRDAAARQGQTEAERSANVQRVENDILATKRQTMAQALAEYRQHIDALNAEANRHLAEIQRIEEAKRQLSMSTEDRIREIQRQGMTEYEATEDRKRQIAELQEQARTALANGELEHARQLAQQAMDMVAQVATAQTNEAKRAEEARKQSEQSVTQAAQLEAQAREARRNQEYAQADQLEQQAAQLRAENAQKVREADSQATQGKQGVADAIDRIRQSEDILNQSLDTEAAAHRTAAQAATSSRDEIAATLAQTQSKIDEISAKLSDGLKVTLSADTSRFDQALADLDKALAEKQYLLQIQADLQQAETQLKGYEQLLKEGKTLPVDADMSKAQAALDKLKTYADQNAQFELKVSTEKAQAAVGNVERQITALNNLQTESRHVVNSNADAARAEIQSLNGMNTSSTHTIYITKVETNATGGLVGGVRRFADGGAVAPAFPRMASGTVPGSGHHDTVPRTLDAGAFVIRKAAVQKYGAGRLAALARGVAHFGMGGPVNPPEKPKRNRAVVEALKTIDLGLQGMDEYTSWVQFHYGTSVSPDMKMRTMQNYGKQAFVDRNALEKLVTTKTLTSNENAIVEGVKRTWRSAMAQPLVYGKDLERDLIDYMESLDGQFFARGGLSKSDTVPAMLTPGEFVVNRSAVARLGAGFFAAINDLSAPAQALAGRALASVQGFADGGLVAPVGTSLPRPSLPDGAPTRTVRVELAAGGNKVNATVDGRDEARLLQLLDAARARTA